MEGGGVQSEGGWRRRGMVLRRVMLEDGLWEVCEDVLNVRRRVTEAFFPRGRDLARLTEVGEQRAGKKVVCSWIFRKTVRKRVVTRCAWVRQEWPTRRRFKLSHVYFCISTSRSRNLNLFLLIYCFLTSYSITKIISSKVTVILRRKFCGL